MRCIYCGAEVHLVTSCPKFLERNVKDRRGIANSRKWSYNCLGQHLQRVCQRSEPCLLCQSKHHRVLCLNKNGVGKPDDAGRSPIGGGPHPHQPHQTHVEPRRGSPRTGGGTTPPSPPVEERYLEMERQAALRRFSPPLHERPRLERRPPQFGCVRGYQTPVTGRVGRNPGSPVDRYQHSNQFASDLPDDYQPQGSYQQ